MMDDRIKVLCSRCKTPFRERLSNVRNGSQTQCPRCFKAITFDSDSQDPGIMRAMRDARRLRTGYVPPSKDEPAF
jgi:DNA-directed RNA polymerase subunit RPC12/RpoP